MIINVCQQHGDIIHNNAILKINQTNYSVQASCAVDMLILRVWAPSSWWSMGSRGRGPWWMASWPNNWCNLTA